MYSLKEFIWLSNRSEGAFWASISGIGDGWQLIFTRIVMFRQSLQFYAKRFHHNGNIDEIQERAVCHLNRASLRLWPAYRKAECKPYDIQVDGEKINKCGRHGDKLSCRKDYEGLVNKHIFPR